MDRSIASSLCTDLESKVVLLSGPRQVGKTTLAKMLFPNGFTYLNYDLPEHRLILQEKSWNRRVKLVVFGELHKKSEWKTWIKGIFDTEGVHPHLLVTGSARLNTYRRVGDSLAGRFFHHRLHPLDIKELAPHSNPEAALEALLTCSGFPEPFLKGSETFYKRWRRTHVDVILRHDLLLDESVSDIRALETLIELLRQRVGGTVSYANLARDIEKDPKTVKRWLDILENHYVIFRTTPYHRNVARSLLKEPKFYFYDTAFVNGDRGAKLENLVAVALRKELDGMEDTTGVQTALHYTRTKDGREIDFAVCIDTKVTHLIEVKTSDGVLSPHFGHFAQFFPQAQNIQLVESPSREKTFPGGAMVIKLAPWLQSIHL
jgi:predicted AAA+ superfamily ATPase